MIDFEFQVPDEYTKIQIWSDQRNHQHNKSTTMSNCTKSPSQQDEREREREGGERERDINHPILSTH
jgi:hypothetical protein